MTTGAKDPPPPGVVFVPGEEFGLVMMTLPTEVVAAEFSGGGCRSREVTHNRRKQGLELTVLETRHCLLNLQGGVLIDPQTGHGGLCETCGNCSLKSWQRAFSNVHEIRCQRGIGSGEISRRRLYGARVRLWRRD